MSNNIIRKKKVNQSNHEVLISFIIPVYNTKEYLIETLNSLIVNRYTSEGQIEIIIVDDGSTDQSAELITKWLDMHNVNAIFIQQKNQGLSLARKTGMAHASGQYIGFCDSDDKIDITVYIQMAMQANTENCDVAICRSEVFNHMSGVSYDFYDWVIWNDILGNKAALITSSFKEPRVFRLEPNANTRLLKRSFIDTHNIEFPKGLHYEDLPVHVLENALAEKILLFNKSGYFYRVDRPGKITDEKSEKRFDMLKIAELTFKNMRETPMLLTGQAFALHLIIRMVFWCGEETLNKDKKSFFSQACSLFSSNVTFELFNESNKYASDFERLILSHLMVKNVNFLIAYSVKKRVTLHSIPLLLNQQYGKEERNIAKNKLLNKIKGK